MKRWVTTAAKSIDYCFLSADRLEVPPLADVSVSFGANQLATAIVRTNRS